MNDENGKGEANGGGLYEKRVEVWRQGKVEESQVGKVNVDTWGRRDRACRNVTGESSTQSRITQRGKRHKISNGKVGKAPTTCISAQEQARRSNQRNHQGYAEPRGCKHCA